MRDLIGRMKLKGKKADLSAEALAKVEKKPEHSKITFI